MTQETTTPTKEELVAAHNEALTNIKDAEKAHQTAQKAFDAAVGKVGTEELVALATPVTEAKALVDRMTKLATRAKERVDGYELEAKRDERNALIARDVAEAKDATDFATYRAVGVEKLVLTIDMTEETVSAKPSGPGIRTASTTPRTRTSNGSGFTSRGGIRFADGREFPSVNRAYMTLRAQADGTEPAPANTKSASKWLTDKVGSFEFVAPQ